MTNCNTCDDLISVIVAVYNAKDYLERCIESIRNQTYENVEIILVDDGSTDGSEEICDKYKDLDDRIKVVHKENGKKNPINVGVSISSGKYIGIVDDDDFIDNEMYEKMYNSLVKHDADLVLCNYMYVDEEERDLKVKSPLLNSEVISHFEGLRRISLPMGNYYITVWNKLYKAELLKETPVPMRTYGDNYIVHRIFDKCERISIISDMLYFYTQRAGSLSRHQKGYKYFDLVESYLDRVEYYIEKGYYELIPNSLQQMLEVYVQMRRRYITKEKRKIAGLKIAKTVKKDVKRVSKYCREKGIIIDRCLYSISDISIIKQIISDKIRHTVGRE